MDQEIRYFDREQPTGIAVLLAVAVLMLMNAAAAQNGTPGIHEPSEPRGSEYYALTGELDRQLEAMQNDYEMREAIVVAEIDRRRRELLAPADDGSARDDGEQALTQLQQQAISALQAELAENRGFLEEVRGFAAAELDEHGTLSDSTWGMIASFSDAHRLTMPDGFPVPQVTVDEYEGFPAALVDCSEYEETKRHPWTGNPMTTIIHGIVDERCHIEEQLPGDGLMTCRYTLERLPAVADYYANTEKYESLSISSHTEFVDGVAVTTNTYMLDGELYDHPVDAALTAGECVVSGY